MKPLVLALLTSVLAFPADLPDAKALLGESGNGLFLRSSFRMTTHTKARIKGAKTLGITMDTRLAAADRRFRAEMGPDIMLSFTIVSDGQFTYHYIAETNQYTKKSSIKSPRDLAGAMIRVEANWRG